MGLKPVLAWKTVRHSRHRQEQTHSGCTAFRNGRQIADIRRYDFPGDAIRAYVKFAVLDSGEINDPLKSNANLAKSPTQTVRTQSNHVFISIYAVFKLECLSLKTKINPFALRLKLLINASRSAYAELQQWRATA